MSTREIVCEDLNLAIDDLRRDGFRLDVIYPAEEPKAAVLSRGGELVRVSIAGAPSVADRLPEFAQELVLTRAGSASTPGRAGMLYRDLIPGCLGGRYIASHITIPDGGRVDDWVHYHQVALQIIAVRSGWVRVVYEDQGEPFVMNAGDVVLQPPAIRHRVLESSAGLEVIEITAPALHQTFADHDLALPNGTAIERLFGRQRFAHHVAASGAWTNFGNGQAQETSIAEASCGLVDVHVVRPGRASTIAFAPHDGELVFGFVLEGSARLGDEVIGAGDAVTVPPARRWTLADASRDFRLLHVTSAQLD